ncbi:DDB1- and CUL4-associated factor 13 [Smittium culicis]|uniref:DDB1-and CUL4-associated factor 13 n=1 Tax=Smittium culicis TaxID=133412 RepID=A0A1R1X5Y0_9FUNG|nr:DDB1- and CUL4-associated factor 13 [Smittium culicis]
MKVKMLSKSSADHVRERTSDINKVKRNLDPELHPLEKPREYTRAVRAAKLERMFAKPFLASLDGHIDGVYALAKNPWKLDLMYSGSGDGEIRAWSLSNQATIWRKANAHQGLVSGIIVVPETTNSFISAGTDKTVKIWSLDQNEPSQNDINQLNHNASNTDHILPVSVYSGKEAFLGIDHHRSNSQFATCSSEVSIWDVNRSQPILNLAYGCDTINSVKLNQSEVNVLASTGSDRTIVLYDLRMSTPIVKLTMSLKSNALSWNPMEPFIFAAANEDHNAYLFDMRKMDHATNVLKDHVSAVMDVDFSPTGAELVTSSYDRTIRIFNTASGHSRDVYHTKRMQRVFTTKFSCDNKFILSASDDGNLRLWRAQASQRVGSKSNRERSKLEYMDTVKSKFSHLPQVRKILRQRNLPRDIRKATLTKRDMIASRKTKENNVRAHSKPGAVPFKSERTKNILNVTSK